MAISLASLTRNSKPKPARVLVYGVSGVGKSSLAASAPAPVFLPTEDGLGKLPVDSFPLLKSWTDVYDALVSLHTGDHDFRTVVIDSLDWLEPLIWSEVVAQNKWESIETPGYGKGYAAALDLWRIYIDWLNALRDDRGMQIVQIAHCDIKRFDSPESEPYDRYLVKLQSKAAALMMEHSDAVLFANYRVSTTKSDVGFGQKKVRAVGSGDRVLYTAERPAFNAKNRYGLPDSISLPKDKPWSALAEYLPAVSPPVS